MATSNCLVQQKKVIDAGLKQHEGEPNTFFGDKSL